MRGKHMLALLMLPVIWGGYYVFTQQAVHGLGALAAGAVIRFITMILLLVILLAKKELALLVKTKYVLKRLILIGLLGFLLDITAFIGLSIEGAGTGVALLKCDIIFVNLLSVLVFKEKFTKWDWGFSLVMLVGVMMIMGVDIGHLSLANKGNVFFILSALFVSINAFVIKSVQTDKRNPVADNVVAFYNNFITMCCFFVAALVTGGLGNVTLLFADRTLLLYTLLAAVGQTSVYLVYYYNLRRFPVWIVKVFLLLMPIVSAGLTFVLFGETLGRMQCIGIAVVLAGALGILLMQRNKNPKPVTE